MAIPTSAIFSKSSYSSSCRCFEYALTGQQFNSIKWLFHCKTFPQNLFPSNTHPKWMLRAGVLAKFMFQYSYVLAPFHCKSLQSIWMWSLWPDILAGLQQGTDSSEGKTFVPVMMVQLLEKQFMRVILNLHNTTISSSSLHVHVMLEISTPL